MPEPVKYTSVINILLKIYMTDVELNPLCDCCTCMAVWPSVPATVFLSK